MGPKSSPRPLAASRPNVIAGTTTSDGAVVETVVMVGLIT